MSPIMNNPRPSASTVLAAERSVRLPAHAACAGEHLAITAAPPAREVTILNTDGRTLDRLVPGESIEVACRRVPKWRRLWARVWGRRAIRVTWVVVAREPASRPGALFR